MEESSSRQWTLIGLGIFLAVDAIAVMAIIGYLAFDDRRRCLGRSKRSRTMDLGHHQVDSAEQQSTSAVADQSRRQSRMGNVRDGQMKITTDRRSVGHTTA